MSKIFIRIFKILFLIILGSTIFLSLAFLVISQKLNENPKNLLINIYQGLTNKKYSNQSNLNFILLGLDKRDDQLEKTNTTDTIIFGSLDFNKTQLNLISLPRDIWNYQTKSKINDIYPQSLNSSDMYSYIQSNYGNLTGQNIEKTVIITTNNLIEFANLIGGVDVYLKNGFIDTKYPNPEYIKTLSPKIPIYKTIEFKSGWVHLDKSNITEFVRSRKGAETAAAGGTDIGRIERQQLLINSIIDKVKSKEFLGNTNNLINLYQFWHRQINTNFSDQDLISIGLKINKNLSKISINKIEIPIGQTAKEGVIYHPTKFINKQWVFTTADENYSELKKFISGSLNQSSVILNY